VLVNGASGGLGGLALQVLRAWGSQVTAICGPGKKEDCLALGAASAVERGATTIESLRSDFRVILNFASRDDDLALASRLGPDRLGHATAVHPLLANFDRLGWLQGALVSRREWKQVRSAGTRGARRARYAWTGFRFDHEALDVLEAGMREQKVSLPVGMRAPFEDAGVAFAHVAAGKPGRAVLLP
jgi:NADPH:quinone reductase-like Zn-dependent oxidoreductase